MLHQHLQRTQFAKQFTVSNTHSELVASVRRTFLSMLRNDSEPKRTKEKGPSEHALYKTERRKEVFSSQRVAQQSKDLTSYYRNNAESLTIWVRCPFPY